MPKWFYAVIALLALAAGVLAQRWWSAPGASADHASAAAAAAPVREPPLRDLDGRIRSLSEWRGRVVLLNFWATWCPPCREEMPEFARLQRELGGRGLTIVGVAIDDPDEVRDFLAGNPVNYPILIGDGAAPAWAAALGDENSVLPFSVVFDRDGAKVMSHTGVFRREPLLNALKPLLSEEARR